jgi:VIT1/CCC1 family predicted Fe2+/Mn2+ transporter
VIAWVGLSSLAFLAILGAVAAKVGGASMRTGALRIATWGALAMAATTAIGHLFGVVA